MGGIFNMFGPSPIRPLEKHMRKVHEAVKKLRPFFDAVLAQDWDKATEIKTCISKLEREADVMKRDLRIHLPTGLFLPVGRTDLLELLSAQDRIANKAEDIAGLMVSRKMVLPESITPLFIPFVSQCVEASRQACKAINELDELLESGFRGNEVKIVEDMIIKLDEIEHESDEQLAKLLHEIFMLEQDFPPMEVMFLYRLVNWIGELADRAQTVGGRLQILIAR